MPSDTNVSDALAKLLDERRLAKLPASMGDEFQRLANVVGARCAVTSEEAFFFSTLFNSIFWMTRRSCRPVVGTAHVDVGVVLGLWHADPRQNDGLTNLESETASDTTLNCFYQVCEGCCVA